MKANHGFSLLELMVVIAIIGIVIAFAIPSYQNYTIRSKVAEGLQLASGVKIAIAEHFLSAGDFIADGCSDFQDSCNSAYGLASSTAITGSHTASITAGANGFIRVVYNENSLGGDTSSTANALYLVPDASGGSFIWECYGGEKINGVIVTLANSPNRLPADYIPQNCRQ